VCGRLGLALYIGGAISISIWLLLSLIELTMIDHAVLLAANTCMHMVSMRCCDAHKRHRASAYGCNAMQGAHTGKVGTEVVTRCDSSR